MTISKKQLQKAAKAAGIEVGPFHDFAQAYWFSYYAPHYWTPHIDHGQLLDLAIACKICIEPRYNLVKYQIERTGLYVSRSVNCKDFPALAEAVIMAACEQFDAKGAR